jgi:hypothetical protein
MQIVTTWSRAGSLVRICYPLRSTTFFSVEVLSPGRRVFERLSTLLCCGVVIGYCCLLVVSPAFGPNDDHRLLDTVQIGKPLPFYISPSDGRFYPLVAEEYWLLSKISASPRLYYVYNAAQLVVFSFLFRFVLGRATSSRALINLATLGVVLAPGFPMTWFRLHVPERDVVFFLAVFLASFLALEKTSRPLVLLSVGLAAGNIALYYKEPTFVLLGVFSLCYLAGPRERTARWQRGLGVLMLLGCGVFLVFYYFVAVRQMAGPRYGEPSSGALAFFLEAIGYGVINDPVMLCLVLPLFVSRVYALAKDKGRFRPLPDSALFAAVAYAGAFFVLRLQSPYYLLPSYIFAMPGLVHHLEKLWVESRVWRSLSYLTALLFCTVGVPTTLRIISDAKYWPINLTGATDTIAERLRASQTAPNRRIVLLDVKPGDGLEMCVSFKAFLRARGIPRSRFCVASSGRVGDAVVAQETLPVVPFLKQEDCGRATSSGDFVVVIPYLSHITDYGKLFSWLGRQHRLIFRSESRLAFPNLLRFLKDVVQGHARFRDVLSSPAYYPDFFVFERV